MEDVGVVIGMYYAQRLMMAVRSLGARAAIPYLFGERIHSLISGRNGSSESDLCRIHPRALQYPVYARYGSSDRHVFAQIFVEQEYQIVSDTPDPKIIIDCGANVGFSTAYFLSKFPSARVIAIEPDERNIAMLMRNTAPYGDRVTVLHSAVWSRPTGLVVCRGAYRDGLEWATQVRECRPGEQADLEAIDIGSLFARFGFETIDILKMDIERSEVEVFATNFESWVDRTQVFVIELHDQECVDVFRAALARSPFEFSRSGELTVAKRIRPV